MFGLKHWELRHAAPGCHGYRDSGDSSSSSTSTSTENYTKQTDKRVVNDGGGSVVSNDAGTVSLNVTNNNMSADALAASISLANSAAENARQMAASSVAAAAAANQSMAQVATVSSGAMASVAGRAADGAFDLANLTERNAFDFNMSGTKAAYQVMSDALGYAKDAMKTNFDVGQSMIARQQTAVSDAYQTAQENSNGQKMLVTAAMAVVAVVAVFAFRGS